MKYLRYIFFSHRIKSQIHEVFVLSNVHTMASVETKYHIERLNNENYFVWKFKLRMLMVKEGTWFCIDLAAPAATETTKLEEWSKKDQQGLATIGLNVSDDQLIHIRNAKTSKEAWIALQEYHEKNTANSKVRLMKTIMRLRLEEGGDMEAHLSRINELFQQMVDLNTDVKPEDWKSATMLGSLPESYDTLVTALESRKESELTAAVVQSKLIDEYKRRKDRGELNDGNGSALKVMHKSKNKLSQFKKKDIVCYRCGNKGHYAKKCKAGDKEKKATDEKKLNLATERDECDTCCEFAFITNELKSGWFVDSGATSHITSNKALFKSLDTYYRDEVSVANGQVVDVKGKGTVRIEVMNKFDEQNVVVLNDVLWAPSIKTDLISVNKLNEKGCDVLFSKDKRCEISFNGKQVAVGLSRGGLRRLKETNRALIAGTDNKIEENTESGNSGCIHKWHRILGHRDIKVVKTLSKFGHVKGVKIIPCTDECKDCDDKCRVCLQGKMMRIKFPENAQRTENMLDLIHSDVCGPMKTASASGKRYILTLIDDFSRFTVIHLLEKKSEVFQKFKEYVEMVKTMFGKKPKYIRSDRGGEYVNKEFHAYLKQEGIQQQRTAPYTPQQNGVAERKNRTLVEMARCMLIDAGMPHIFWAEAVVAANYTQNRLPGRSILTTPFESWFGCKPKLDHMRVFGSECYVWISPQKRHKLENKSVHALFVGYDNKSKAYRCYDTKTGKILISRDVQFLHKRTKLEIKIATPARKYGKLNNSNDSICNDDHTVIVRYGMDAEQSELDSIEVTHDADDSFVDADVTLQPNAVSFTDSDAYFGGKETLMDTSAVENEENTHGNNDVQRSERTNKGTWTSTKFQDEIFSVKQATEEPLTYNEAIRGVNKDEWVKAMEEEMVSLRDNNTWELVDLPTNRKPIGCKWVYKIKRNEKGEPQRFKARLVAQGFMQKYGFDYDEIFAPVARQTTFRILLTVAARTGMKVVHYDAKTAFLHGELKEEIYMKQPPGFVANGKEHQVCFLKRSLYGLKQSARIWNQSVHNVFINSGFIQSKNDQCLYIRKQGDDICFVIIYVDDLLVASKNENMIKQCEQFLSSEFKLQNLGEVRTYLGIQVNKNKNRMFTIDQSVYINKVLKEFGMQNSKVSEIPLSVNYGKGDESELLRDNNDYRKLIGSLLYISTNTRPDIAASVAILSQQVSAPTQEDWNEAKRILKYLKGTVSLKLNLNVHGDKDKLIGYSDANFAECRLTRKSNGGFTFSTFGATISWRCKKQDIIALSSMEAEYIALCDAVKEAKWLKRLLNDFGVEINEPIILYEDNQSCLKFATEEKFSNRSKHIDIKTHSVKESIDTGIVECVYCPTDEMVADMMTKPLPKQKIQKFREAAGLFE